MTRLTSCCFRVTLRIIKEKNPTLVGIAYSSRFLLPRRPHDNNNQLGFNVSWTTTIFKSNYSTINCADQKENMSRDPAADQLSQYKLNSQVIRLSYSHVLHFRSKKNKNAFSRYPFQLQYIIVKLIIPFLS